MTTPQTQPQAAGQAAHTLTEENCLLRSEIAQLKLKHSALFAAARADSERLNKIACLHAQDMETYSQLLKEVQLHHAAGLEHVKNQERTLTEYSVEVASLRARVLYLERTLQDTLDCVHFAPITPNALAAARAALNSSAP